MTAMLVATSGGHLTQLHLLRPRIAPRQDVVWVTDRTPQSGSLLAGEPVVELPTRAPRAYLGVLRDALTVGRAMRRDRIGHVYSTGAQMALSALIAAKVLRVPFSYIESGTRVHEKSATGRVIARVPGVGRYVQYPFAADDRWRYAVSVFEWYRVERVPPPAGRAPRVVVSVGGNSTYGFERMIRALHRILPADWDVLWQVGPSEVGDLGIEAVRSLPAGRLRDEIAAADLVISHAGTGSILTALALGRRPVVVPRRAAHGEHVDSHQDDLARYVAEAGLALVREAGELTLDDLRDNLRYRVHATADLSPVELA
jgi:UDP-N-acetylglucosamine transferase subunit ALG13